MLPKILLLIVFESLLFRESHLDKKRFIEKRRLDNEHILREVEKFKKMKGIKQKKTSLDVF